MTSDVRFLIVGTARSGTTLVQRLACEIPGVMVPPETHFFPFWRTYAQEETLPLDEDGIRRATEAFLRLNTSVDLDLDPERLVDRLAGRCASPIALFEAIVMELAGPAELYGEKTPRHLLWWRPLTKALPGLRLIGVVRDPRAVIASLLRMPWAGDRHELLAERWAFEQEELLQAMGHLGEERCLVLRYEDIVADASQARDRIATFLGRATPDTAVDVPLDRIALHWEYWKRDATGPITDDRLTAWRSELGPRETREVAAICRRPMLRFGYPDDVPGWWSSKVALLRLGRRNRKRLRRRHHLRTRVADEEALPASAESSRA